MTELSLKIKMSQYGSFSHRAANCKGNTAGFLLAAFAFTKSEPHILLPSLSPQRTRNGPFRLQAAVGEPKGDVSSLV